MRVLNGCPTQPSVISRALWLVLLAAGLPSVAFGQAKRLAVYDFEYKAVRGDVVQVYGSDKNVGAQVANRLISKLVNGKGAFDVIDRNQIDTLMKEQNLKFSDRFDPRDAPKLGKLLNVDAIITGSVDQIADEVQNNRVGIGPIGLGKSQSVAEVTVSVRVISTETAKIFMAEQVNNKQTHSLGKGGKVGNSGGDGGSITMHPGAVSANQALQGAADDIAAKIIARASDLPSRSGASSHSTAKSEPAHTNSVPSSESSSPGRLPDTVGLTVGRVDGGKLYITAGENAGLKVNDYLEVRHVTGTMKDDQGHDINVDEKVETVVVTDVQERFAVAKLSGAGASAAKVGDKLKKVRAPAAPKKAPTHASGAIPAPVQRKQ